MVWGIFGVSSSASVGLAVGLRNNWSQFLNICRSAVGLGNI